MTAGATNRWTMEDARLLTMISTSPWALRLGEFFHRCDIASIPDAELAAESMSRLVGAGLAGWADGRFFVTANGRIICPAGPPGRYFKDLTEESFRALAAVAAGPQGDLKLVTADLEGAVAYVLDRKEAHRTRRGYAGRAKWGEWSDAPPLSFGDCVEFLTFQEGAEVDVQKDSDGARERFVGVLGVPLSDASRDGSRTRVTFPVQVAGSPVIQQVVLDSATFTTASFDSFDDDFELEVRFDDGAITSIVSADYGRPAE